MSTQGGLILKTFLMRMHPCLFGSTDRLTHRAEAVVSGGAQPVHGSRGCAPLQQRLHLRTADHLF